VLLSLTLFGCSPDIGGPPAPGGGERSALLDAGSAFAWGFGTSLTPCVYPMIAITVSVFGAKQAKSRKEAALLSTAFVVGMAVLFTILFVVAALTGGMFGEVLQNKWVHVGIGVIFVALAASMFGAFELELPDSVMQRLSGVGGVGVGGAFTLGLVTGPIAAPCSGPGLIYLLTKVTAAQDWKLGILFGMSYSLGLGILFWVVGTFAASLPKGGSWMVWVKSVFGIALVVLALRELAFAFPALTAVAENDLQFVLIAAAIAVAGLAAGAVHLDWSDGGIVTKLRKAVGIAATVSGAFLLISSMSKAPAEPSKEELIEEAKKHQGESNEPVRILEWHKEEGKAIDQARAEGRPLILDFGADWCAACKELEHKTFADKEVMVKAGRFVAARIDLSNDDDPKNAELKKKYNIQGLPAVLLIDSSGKEVDRITKFVEPKEFLAAIEPVK
jgi:thiol:disulfide interchange protein DsbD